MLPLPSAAPEPVDQAGEQASASPVEPPDRAVLEDVYQAAVGRYADSCRRRIRPFLAAHFSFKGALRIHRRAVGWDLLRAPANMLLAIPYIAVQAAGTAAAALRAPTVAAHLRALHPLLKTDVGRQIEWLIHAELLELPHRDATRTSRRDGLVDEIMRDPRVVAALEALLGPIVARSNDARFRQRLTESLDLYAVTRTAAAELTTALFTAGIGSFTVKQFTPGAMTLGPVLAGVMAQNAAVASFPLGSSLGGLWYGTFPTVATPSLIAGVTGGLLAGSAVLAAFAGILADPLQRRLGLHERRLNRLIDALERQLLDPDARGLKVRDHYVARLVDLFDMLISAHRLARA